MFNNVEEIYKLKHSHHISTVRTTIRLYTQTRNVMLVDTVRSDVYTNVSGITIDCYFFRSIPIIFLFNFFVAWLGGPRKLGGPGSLNRLNPR